MSQDLKCTKKGELGTSKVVPMLKCVFAEVLGTAILVLIGTGSSLNWKTGLDVTQVLLPLFILPLILVSTHYYDLKFTYHCTKISVSSTLIFKTIDCNPPHGILKNDL